MAPSRRTERSPLLPILVVVLLGALGALGFLLLSDDGDGDDDGGSVVSHDRRDQGPGRFDDPAPEPTQAQPETLQPKVPDAAPIAIVQEMFGDTGMIAGRVVYGTEPCEGVEVTLWQGNDSINAAWTALRKKVEGIHATADADGRFVLEHVPAGKGYVVVGEHADYAASEMGNIKVDPGVVTGDVMIRMSEGAIIGGRVTDELTGNAIAGARAELTNTLEKAMNPDSDDRPWKVVFADNQGRYAFAHVSAPNIKVKISADGYETRSRSVNFALEGKARDRTDIDFELGIGHSLSGRVQSAAGVPIPDAQVLATALTKAFQGEALAYTDRAGYFLLEGLGEHGYQLRTSARGYSTDQQPKVEYNQANLVIILDPRGQVAGKVRDYSGNPVSSFKLHLMRAQAGRDPVYQNDARSFSSADGSFVFDDLDPGLYVLESRGQGFAPSRSQPFEVRREEVTPDLEIVMGTGGTLRGLVKSPDGKPIEGATVLLNTNNHVENAIARIFGSLTPSGGPKPTAVTDRKGEYVLEHVPVGIYQVAVTHRDWAGYERNDVAIADDTAGGNPRLDVTLPRGAVLGGHALDEANRPLTFARVQLTDGAGFMETTTTDGGGSFRFENLREGNYKVTLSPDRDANGRQLNPIIVLVYSQKSTLEVYLGAGQVMDDMTLYLRTQG